MPKKTTAAEVRRFWWVVDGVATLATLQHREEDLLSQFLESLPSRRRGRPPIERPEHVIGQPVRLRMLTALAETERLSFNQLLERASTNCGGMSHHARRLEAFGYITTRKSFVGRLPLTEYELTHEGRQALLSFLNRQN